MPAGVTPRDRRWRLRAHGPGFGRSRRCRDDGVAGQGPTRWLTRGGLRTRVGCGTTNAMCPTSCAMNRHQDDDGAAAAQNRAIGTVLGSDFWRGLRSGPGNKAGRAAMPIVTDEPRTVRTTCPNPRRVWAHHRPDEGPPSVKSGGSGSGSNRNGGAGRGRCWDSWFSSGSAGCSSGWTPWRCAAT